MRSVFLSIMVLVTTSPSLAFGQNPWNPPAPPPVTVWMVPKPANRDFAPTFERQFGDVAQAPDGTIWNEIGGQLYRFVGGKWEFFGGDRVSRVSVGPQGPWVVDWDNVIYEWVGNRWDRKPGKGTDVAVSTNGQHVWIIGADREIGGYGIWTWNAKSAVWNKVAGSGVRIGVEPNGRAWVVTSGNAIFRYEEPGGFKHVKGRAKDVRIGSDGAVYVIGTDDVAFEWKPTPGCEANDTCWVRK